jgi:hypothetical protein
MDTATKHALTKVPEVTLVFWIIKIAATTLGETGGDAVSMSMNLGYLIGTIIFAIILSPQSLLRLRQSNFIHSFTGRRLLQPPRLVRRWPILRIAPLALAMPVGRPCFSPCCAVLCLYGIER